MSKGGGLGIFVAGVLGSLTGEGLLEAPSDSSELPEPSELLESSFSSSSSSDLSSPFLFRRRYLQPKRKEQ